MTFPSTRKEKKDGKSKRQTLSVPKASTMANVTHLSMTISLKSIQKAV